VGFVRRSSLNAHGVPEHAKSEPEPAAKVHPIGRMDRVGIEDEQSADWHGENVLRDHQQATHI
jgi:hypothetical protein